MDLVLPDSKEKVVRKLTLWSLLSFPMQRRGEAPLFMQYHFQASHFLPVCCSGCETSAPRNAAALRPNENFCFGRVFGRVATLTFIVSLAILLAVKMASD